MTWINNGNIHKYIPVRILKDFLKDNPNWKAGRIK